MKNKNGKDDVLLVSFDRPPDYSDDYPVLVVMRRTGGTVEVVNVFSSERAEDLYKRLTE